MTERPRGAVRRAADAFEIGDSAWTWTGSELRVRIRETAAPIPRALVGEVVVRPEGLCREEFVLDPAARHVWRPLAPRARVEVRLAAPEGGWSGEGYLDCNYGSEPLEAGFESWDWSREHGAAETLIAYDLITPAGPARLALEATADGSLLERDLPPARSLSPTFWRLDRRLRTGVGELAVAGLEDAPFYARTCGRGRAGDGRPVHILHETLRLDRLRSPLVRGLLPFRMPRRSRFGL